MGNCFKTQLKESVNNNALSKLGSLQISLHVANEYAENNAYFIYVAPVSITITVAGDGYVYRTVSGEKVKSLTLPANCYDEIHYTNGNYYIYCSNKYDINYFALNGFGTGDSISAKVNAADLCASYSLGLLGFNTIFGDVKNLKDCINLSDIFVSSSLSGDLNYLQGKPLREVRSYETKLNGSIDNIANNNFISCAITENLKITGSIESFGSCIAAESMTLNGTSVTGEIETLAAAQVANGRTSGTLNIVCNGIITYQGTTVDNLITKIITFSNGSYSVA